MSYQQQQQYQFAHDQADQQRRAQESQRQAQIEQARSAFNARNNYASGVGAGYDPNGGMQLSGPWSQYASPRETSNAASILAGHNAEFNKQIGHVADSNSAMNEQDNLKQQNWEKLNNEKAMDLQATQTGNQHTQALGETAFKREAMAGMNGMGMGFGGFSHGLTRPSPTTNLYGSDGARIGGGSFLRGLYS